MPTAHRRQSTATRIRPKKSDQIPVTKKVVDKTRAELLRKNTSLQVEMRAGFKSVKAQFKAADAKIEGLRSEMKAGFNQVDARFNEFETKMNDMKAEILFAIGKIAASVERLEAQAHRTHALVEENSVLVKFALDGYAAVDYRIDLLEKKPKDV